MYNRENWQSLRIKPRAADRQTDRQTDKIPNHPPLHLHLLSSHIVCLPDRDFVGGHFQNVHASDHRLVVIAMALELRTFIHWLKGTSKINPTLAFSSIPLVQFIVY